MDLAWHPESEDAARGQRQFMNPWHLCHVYYRIVGNFWGRKLSREKTFTRISWFYSHPWNFRHATPIMRSVYISRQFSQWNTPIIPTNQRKFSPLKVSRYTVYLSDIIVWHIILYIIYMHLDNSKTLLWRFLLIWKTDRLQWCHIQCHVETD